MNHYVTLTYDPLYINNTPSNYFTILDQPLIINGKVEVALIDINYPINYSTNYGNIAIELPEYIKEQNTEVKSHFLEKGDYNSTIVKEIIFTKVKNNYASILQFKNSITVKLNSYLKNLNKTNNELDVDLLDINHEVGFLFNELNTAFFIALTYSFSDDDVIKYISKLNQEMQGFCTTSKLLWQASEKELRTNDTIVLNQIFLTII